MTLTIELPWQPPPLLIAREDEAPPGLYEILKPILDGTTRADRIVIRQISQPEPKLKSANDTAIVMAHRGELSHLNTALHYLRCNPQTPIRVGLDQSEQQTPINGVTFYRGVPAPAGPYAIRQRLAELSPEPCLMFQDSDDIPTSDRLPILRAALTQGPAKLIGSHELVVDEIAQTVTAVRYPLDVTAALRDGPHYSILHPATIVSREAFFAAGGFSTDRIISQDTQFHFRAFFHMPMANVDRFLYIRRKHRESLTNRPETAIGSPFRREVESPWFSDFEAIKQGRLSLENSSLVPSHRTTEHHLVPVT